TPRAGREASPSDASAPGVAVAPRPAAEAPGWVPGRWPVGEWDHRVPRDAYRDGTGRPPGRSAARPTARSCPTARVSRAAGRRPARAGRSPPTTARRGIVGAGVPRPSPGDPPEGSATTTGGRRG